LATGAQDGKIKLWDTKSHYSFCTFTEHTSSVTKVLFTQKDNNTLISCSLDGTVRAFDTKKYKAFRCL